MRRQAFIRAGLLTTLGLTVCSAAASAATLPPRKPGLWLATWNYTMFNSKDVANKIQSAYCWNADVEVAQANKFANGAGCDKTAISLSGSTYMLDSSCDKNGSPMTVHTEYVMTGDTTHSDNTVLSGKGETIYTIDTKWVGPCPAGMQPGDHGTMSDAGVFTKTGNYLDQWKTP